MDFSLHTQFPTQLKDAWNDLLAESVCNVPFLRYEYLEQWWQTRGGAEWPAEAQLILITAWQDNQLLGVAPLFQTLHQGCLSLLFLGSIEISDFLSFIVRPQHLAEFTHGLLDTLLSDSRIPAWEVLDLYNNLDTSGLSAVLEAEAAARGWAFRSEQTDHSPLIHLPGDWEAYLGSLDKKQRHELRRKIRRLQEAELPSRWYIVEDAASLETEIEAFIALMAHDPQKQVFLSGAMKTTMTNTIRSAFQEGYLQLSFLEIGGKKAAAYLIFDYLNCLWVYNSGMDPEFYAYSAGWVLLGYLLQWANENKRTDFDFMRGNEDYKYRFGAVDRFVNRIRLSLTA
jgi:CelD/BcsL family acetyltransferase involved in cellulose biosynthesis